MPVEQLKPTGLGADNPRMKELQANLEIYMKLLDDRVKRHREK
jgi:hypothetical protein